MALRIERQSARMSKIKNGGLDQYGTEPFELQQFGTAGVEGVKLHPGLAPRCALYTRAIACIRWISSPLRRRRIEDDDAIVEKWHKIRLSKQVSKSFDQLSTAIAYSQWQVECIFVLFVFWRQAADSEIVGGG